MFIRQLSTTYNSSNWVNIIFGLRISFAFTARIILGVFATSIGFRFICNMHILPFEWHVNSFNNYIYDKK